MYQRFKSIKERHNVQAVLVSIHDDWVEALEDSNAWPFGDSIHIYTSADHSEVEKWIEGMGADGVIQGWQRGHGVHPGAPPPLGSNAIYTVVWD